jgi:hypothetical protein
MSSQQAIAFQHTQQLALGQKPLACLMKSWMMRPMGSLHHWVQWTWPNGEPLQGNNINHDNSAFVQLEEGQTLSTRNVGQAS